MIGSLPPHLIRPALRRRRLGGARGGSQAGSTPTTVLVSPASFVIDPTGTVQLTATVLDQFGRAMSGETVTWSSSDNTIATVSSSGLVTGVAVGAVTITATDGLIHGTSAGTVSTGTQWHVTTTGLSTNAGTSASPWDIVTALNGGPTGTQIQPGDTVLIHAGSYGTGVEDWNLNAVGSTTRPVIFKANPGDLFSINLHQLDVLGHDVWLYNDTGFSAELYCGASNPDGTDLTRFAEAGDGIKVINWVVHDGAGIGLAPQSETANHEMNGNIVYNNGRSTALSPVWGHGIYAHGTTTVGQTRKIRGNVIFDQAGYGIHSFADTGNEDNFEIFWNMSFGNGVGEGLEMLVGGQTSLTNADIEHNFTFTLAVGPTATIGYYADGDPGVLGSGGVCKRNRFGGRVTLGNWDNAGFQFTHNTILAKSDKLVEWKFQAAAPAMSGNLTDFNTYVSTLTGGFGGWAIQVGAAQSETNYDTLVAFRTALGAGQDANSTYVDAADQGTQIFWSNNEYVAGRAHLWIENPTSASTVAVDLSPAVAVGQTYEIWDVYDLKTETNQTATPVLTGTYAGGTVNVPMTGKTPKPIIGVSGLVPTNYRPVLGVFVVIQTSVGGTPAITTSPTSLSFSATVGGSNPAAQTVSLTSSPAAMGVTASIGYTSGNGWLAVDLDQDRTNAILTATATTGALAAGTYNATITLHSNNAPDKTIGVTFTVNAAGGDPAGFDTLQTALGGSAHVLAAYERRQHWSATSITDTRFSGGTGPALTPDGAPTLDGNGNLVFAAGDDFHSAASALFSLRTAGSMLLVASVQAGSNPASISPSGTPTVYSQVTAGATVIGMWNDSETDTTVALGTTLRPIIMTWDGVNTATIQVANTAAVSHTAGADFDAGNGVLTLGGWFQTNGANGACTIAACHIVDHIVTPTEVSAFVTYATGQLGAVAA